LSAAASDHVALSGLLLDGGGLPLPERRGLVHLAQGRAVRIAIASSSIPAATA